MTLCWKALELLARSGNLQYRLVALQKRFAMRSCLLPEGPKLQKYGCVGGQSQRLSVPRPCRTQTQRTRNFRIRAAALTIPSSFTKVSPKGDLVMVATADAEDKTTGGVLLPSSAQRKPTSGDVESVGDGRVGGKVKEFTTKPGDTVLYSKFGLGATELEVGGREFILIREDDLIGVLPRSGATAADVPDLRPLSDRVLLQVEEVPDETAGGVFLPDSAKEKPIAGRVVRAGPGKEDKETGEFKATRVAEGDRVLYFKWAGDNMETPQGKKYVVVHEQDILCKVKS